jgi:beta-barrel assembly-enhancing protease
MHSDPETAYTGRYSDGKTAQSVPADVRLTERGVEIGFPGAPQAMIWPYGALGVAAPLSRKSADALLTYDFMPGASLFVGDRRFAEAVMKLAPQITARAYGWRSARPWVIAASVIVLAFAGMSLASISPAHWVAGMLPDSTRVSVGQQVITSMVGQRRECTDTQGRAALDKLIVRLTNGIGNKSNFKVRVVNWGLLNAFAAPGEQIVLTRQIITQAKSPEEVAGILAHEMGHGLERHPETAIIRVIGWTAAGELITGGAGTIANLGIGMAQLTYTRAAEREADARAMDLLEKAEISTSGIIDFFRRMSEAEAKTKETKNSPAAPPSEWRSVFSTHPDSAERADTAAAKPNWKSSPALTKEEWQALRTICGPLPPEVKPAAKTEPAVKSAPSEKPQERK